MDTTVADPLLGALLDGRYRIRGRIARGGMATVYHAVDERLDRVVAVKVIHPTHASNARFLAGFEREAKTIAQLTHPNVVAVYDTGEHEGLPYLVMEYVRGRTLREVLAERRKLPPGEAAAVAEHILAAIAAAHRAGLVHRDVKPENVLIGDDQTVKVADFGLAQAVEASTQSDGQLLATAAYVAPELVTDGQADPRSDVYSAGIVLFEMLTGRVPFTAERSVDVAYQHVERDVPAPSQFVPDIPAPLDELVVRATRRDPNARPANGDEFLTELRTARQNAGLNADSIPTQPLSVVAATASVPKTPYTTRDETEEDIFYVPPPRSPRHRSGMLVAALVVVLGLVAALGGWWLGAGRYTETPSLLKLTKEEALATAERHGFSVEFDDGQYSETVPKDVVLDQDPAPREKIVKGGTITLTLSLGKERYRIPELAGKSLRTAEKLLTDIKATYKRIDQYSDDVPKDHVISVSPKPGTVVRPNTTVTLVVSVGPAPIRVPDVVGDHVDVATEDLESEGLVVEVKRQPSMDVPRDHVISQNPEPGTGVGEGTKVTLVVSDGPPQVEVPDVTGKTKEEAERILRGAKFRVNVINLIPGSDVVRNQTPQGGATVDQGSTVTIFV